MELNIYLLEKAGIDFEHGFSRYAGSAYHYSNALLSAAEDPVFERVTCSCISGNVGDLYVCARELKKIADNLGMADVYEAASMLAALLHENGRCSPSSDAALAALRTAIKTVLSGIKEACV